MNRLIKNAVILDCFNGRKTPADILVKGGVISGIGKNLPVETGTEIIDIEEAFVSVGWVEAHTHVDWILPGPALIPEETYPRDGITYVLDAGTMGPMNYASVHRKLASLTIPGKSYLHVARFGTVMSGRELLDPSFLDMDAFRRTLEEYRDEIIGVKIRIDPRVDSDILGTLAKAKELAEETGLPLIVHPTRCPEPLEKILPFLEKNDVYAHTYSGIEPCILDENGRVKECVRKARERGVWYELSHGSNNFTFEVARKALEQDFAVDTISTDLHSANVYAPVRSMSDTMSKMMYLGMSLETIINKVTEQPVRMLGIKDKELGIKVGRKADLTAFRVISGDFALSDSAKQLIHAENRIEVVLTMYGENLYEPRHAIFMN